MIQIHNEEAYKEAMSLAWLDWHSNHDPEVICPTPNISFEKGFRYAYMLVELKEAEIDLMSNETEQLKALSIKYSDLALKNERLERELEQASSLNRIMALNIARLENKIGTLKGMIDEGLGWEDMERDI